MNPSGVTYVYVFINCIQVDSVQQVKLRRNLGCLIAKPHDKLQHDVQSYNHKVGPQAMWTIWMWVYLTLFPSFCQLLDDDTTTTTWAPPPSRGYPLSTTVTKSSLESFTRKREMTFDITCYVLPFLNERFLQKRGSGILIDFLIVSLLCGSTSFSSIRFWQMMSLRSSFASTVVTTMSQLSHHCPFLTLLQ